LGLINLHIGGEVGFDEFTTLSPGVGEGGVVMVMEERGGGGEGGVVMVMEEIGGGGGGGAGREPHGYHHDE